VARAVPAAGRSAGKHSRYKFETFGSFCDSSLYLGLLLVKLSILSQTHTSLRQLYLWGHRRIYLCLSPMLGAIPLHTYSHMEVALVNLPKHPHNLHGHEALPSGTTVSSEHNTHEWIGSTHSIYFYSVDDPSPVHENLKAFFDVCFTCIRHAIPGSGAY
jgi:hypothetical protein